MVETQKSQVIKIRGSTGHRTSNLSISRHALAYSRNMLQVSHAWVEVHIAHQKQSLTTHVGTMNYSFIVKLRFQHYLLGIPA